MKAVVFESYGSPDVLKIREIEEPEVPDDGVLVRVHASSINIAEWYGMTGLPIARILGGGLFKPKDTRLGADFAGVVEAVGKSVTDFKPGNEVFGGRNGAYAEYVSVKNAIALKPANHLELALAGQAGSQLDEPRREIAVVVAEQYTHGVWASRGNSEP